MKASENLRQLFTREFPNLGEDRTRFFQIESSPTFGVGITSTGRFPFLLVLPLGSISEAFVSDLVQAIPSSERELESVVDGSRSSIVASVLYFRDFTRAAEIVLDSIVEALQEDSDPTSVPHLVKQFINLFSLRQRLSDEEVTGFFGELVTMAFSTSPSQLGMSWHVESHERFDFNSTGCRLEVKTSLRSRRVHSFSSTQLPPPAGVSVQIASILTQIVPNGLNVFSVYEELRKALDKPAIRRIDEIFIKFVSKDEFKCQELLFDVDMARATLGVYDAEAIPQPILAHGVLSAQWEADLTSVHATILPNNLAELVGKR